MVIHPRLWSTKAIAMIVFPCGVPRRFGRKIGIDLRKGDPNAGEQREDQGLQPGPGPSCFGSFPSSASGTGGCPGCAPTGPRRSPRRISPHSEDAPGGRSLPIGPVPATSSGPAPAACPGGAAAGPTPSLPGFRRATGGRSPRGTPTGCAPPSCARTEGRGATATGRGSTVSAGFGTTGPEGRRREPARLRMPTRRRWSGSPQAPLPRTRRRNRAGRRRSARAEGGRTPRAIRRSDDSPRRRTSCAPAAALHGGKNQAISAAPGRKIPASVNCQSHVSPPPRRNREGIPVGKRRPAPSFRALLRHRNSSCKRICDSFMPVISVTDVTALFPVAIRPVWTMTSMAETICSGSLRSDLHPAEQDHRLQAAEHVPRESRVPW